MSATVYRPLTADDRAAAETFASRIPFGERAFIDRSLLAPVAVAGWTRPTRARRVGAFDDAPMTNTVMTKTVMAKTVMAKTVMAKTVMAKTVMVGLVTVEPFDGWMDHVGQLRPVVLPEARNRGIARALIGHGVALAEEIGLSKLTVEVMAMHERVIAMFESLGFEREALLRRHVRDGTGEMQDLVVLSRFLSPR